MPMPGGKAKGLVGKKQELQLLKVAVDRDCCVWLPALCFHMHSLLSKARVKS